MICQVAEHHTPTRESTNDARGNGCRHRDACSAFPEAANVLFWRRTLRHQQTLQRSFETPERFDLAWRDVERPLSAIGAELSEGRGSRVRVALKGIRAVFHRPQPKGEVDKGMVKSIRRLLIEAGVKP